jgi:hypothetical protein
MTSLNSLTLKTILGFDAIACGAMAVLLLAGANPLGDWLDLPAGFLRTVGAVLVPWTLLLAVLATRPRVHRAALIDVIAVNLAWVAASVILLIGDWVSPNALGVAFVIVQAIAVGIIAAIQAEVLAQEGNAGRRDIIRA